MVVSIYHCWQQESGRTREPIKFLARIFSHWGFPVCVTNGESTLSSPKLADCHIRLWKVTPPFPKYSAQGHTLGCWGFVCLFFINERKSRTKEKKQRVDFLQKLAHLPAAFTEVTNTAAQVLFPIIISNLQFGFLTRVYLDIPL